MIQTVLSFLPAGLLRRSAAALALALLAAMTAGGLALAPAAPKPAAEAVSAGPVRNDAALYRRVIDRVRAGEGYYPAAAAALREGGYPLKPFVNIRPPTQALAMAVLPSEAVRDAACRLLVAAAAFAWALRLRALIPNLAFFGGAAVIAVVGFVPAATPGAFLFHEAWAGLLIALSLAVHGPKRWGWSVALGLAACLTRELAAPYLLVMGAAALVEGRRREALAWAAAAAAFFAALAVHAHLAQAQILPTDLPSPTWARGGGWDFVLATASWSGLSVILPGRLAALVPPLALAGIFALPRPLGLRLGGVLAGYMAAYAVVGRPDNSYWGLVYAGLLGVAAPFCVAGLRRLWGEAFRTQAV